jgi:iron complex outermembrane recepter protein
VPTLFELFAGQQTFSQPISGALTGQNVVVQVVSGGTFTGGVVLQPSFAPGLSFSANCYRIDIQNAIAAPCAYLQILSMCETSG